MALSILVRETLLSRPGDFRVMGETEHLSRASGWWLGKCDFAACRHCTRPDLRVSHHLPAVATCQEHWRSAATAILTGRHTRAAAAQAGARPA